MVAAARETEIGVEKQESETGEQGRTSLTGWIGHPVLDSDSGAMRPPRCLRHTGESDGSVPGCQVPEHEVGSEVMLETCKKMPVASPL